MTPKTIQTEGSNMPHIAALPNLTAEQTAAAALAAALRENETLRGERDGLIALGARVESELNECREIIADLQKNPLNFALMNLDAGAVLEDAGKKLAELSAVVMSRQLKGKFTLSLTVKPFKESALIFIPEIRVAEPKPEAAQSIFYTTEDGSLSRNDPKQREFGFNGNREDAAFARERRDAESR